VPEGAGTGFHVDPARIFLNRARSRVGIDRGGQFV